MCLIDGLLNGDTCLPTADFVGHVAAMGPFWSVRTIREYVEKVWTAPKRR